MNPSRKIRLAFMLCNTSCSEKLSNLLSPMKRSTFRRNTRTLCAWTSLVPQNSLGTSLKSTARQNAEILAVGVALSIIECFRVGTLAALATEIAVLRLISTGGCVSKVVETPVLNWVRSFDIPALRASACACNVSGHSRCRNMYTYRAVMLEQLFVMASTMLDLQVLD
jgi:hypothetical protein